MRLTNSEKKISKKVNKLCLGILSKHINFSIGDNAVYELCIILKCLIFCAMKKLFFESGLEELANRLKQKVPDADTVNRYIKKKSIEEIRTEFMEIQNELFSKFKKMRLLTGRVMALIDITEIPYWGNKNDKGIVGTKKQKGTSYCYKYISLHALAGGFKVCLCALPVIPFSDKAKLVDELLEIAKQKVRISVVLMDREFSNSKIIPVIEKHGLKYLAPIIKNKKISSILYDLYWYKRNFNCDEICDYEFENGVTTKLFFTPNEKKESSGKLTEQFFSWCTNMDVTPKKREILTEIYKKRWNIENFYRDGKGNFLIKTKTKTFKVRLFFFLLSAILYNLWQLIKILMEMKITAQGWKTSVYELLYSKTNLWFRTDSYKEMIWNELI